MGFACADVTALEDSEISILFDEKLTGGFLKTENGCLNIIEYSLKRNEKPYSLRTFEPYGLLYGAVFVRTGRIRRNGFFMIEFAHPPTGLCSFRSSDGELNLLFDAARESFRHNALDGFMDCASRERAGWLCDSCFTARGEPLWGIENRVERFFMENYRLYPGIGELSPGNAPHVLSGGPCRRMLHPSMGDVVYRSAGRVSCAEILKPTPPSTKGFVTDCYNSSTGMSTETVCWKAFRRGASLIGPTPMPGCRMSAIRPICFTAGSYGSWGAVRRRRAQTES